MDSRKPPSGPGGMRASGSSPAPVEHIFTATLWLWDVRKADTWTFLTLPPEVSAEVGDAADARGPRSGFGAVAVQVRAGSSTWRTSVFPDSASGCYVLPVKRAVRRANEVEAGDELTVNLRVI